MSLTLGDSILTPPSPDYETSEMGGKRVSRNFIQPPCFKAWMSLSPAEVGHHAQAPDLPG